MKFPFSYDQFLDVFKSYNQAVFPAQVLLYVMALAVIFFVFRKINYSGRLISLVLACFWCWMGIAYHFVFFTDINPAAWLFGGLFVLQGVIFLYAGVLRNALTFSFKKDLRGFAGALLVLFSLAGYPLFSYLEGHIYPAAPGFGLPCPTTIFTFGVLCWADKKSSPFIWVIPLLWSGIGFMAALYLDMREDMSLIVAALISVILLIIRRNNPAGKRK